MLRGYRKTFTGRAGRWLALPVLLLLNACQSATPLPLPEIAPTATLVPTPRVDPLLTVNNGPVYRLMEGGEVRHVPDLGTFFTFGFNFGWVTPIPSEQLISYRPGIVLTRWVTGDSDHNLYVLQYGRRWRIDPEIMAQSNVALTDVSPLPDSFLTALPLRGDLKESLYSGLAAPDIVSAVWWQGSIWAVRLDGILQTWTDAGWQPISLPSVRSFSTLAADGDRLVVGSEGDVLAYTADGEWQTLWEGSELHGYISALAASSSGDTRLIWAADANHYDPETGRFRYGSGLIEIRQTASEQGSRTVSHVASLDPENYSSHPERAITALAIDSLGRVWAGTQFDATYIYHPTNDQWMPLAGSVGAMNGTRILALLPDSDRMWVASSSGLAAYPLAAPDHYLDSTGKFTWGLARSGEEVWAAGDNFIALWRAGEGWQVFDAFTTLALLDHFRAVVIDDSGNPIFVGARSLIRFDGRTWQRIDAATGGTESFVPGQLPASATSPVNFPSPTDDYAEWLQAWPRPRADSGRCIHYLQGPAEHAFEDRLMIERLRRIGARWVLINVTKRQQLLTLAPLFKEAGITPIWRPYVRPYQSYAHWADDVRFLRSMGVAPYIQIYNEPSIDQEWDGQPVDEALYRQHMLEAAQQVFDAGGFVGLQQIELEWLRRDVQALKTSGPDGIFDRLFFVPHPYGANHPPEYDEDIHAVLGFKPYGWVFQDELGFVPPMIAGEGGWRLGDGSDTRYPVISEELHRDYYMELFGWFERGQLSNGEPLPDTLLAFCPWLLADANDPAGWWDSASGDRTLTIEEIEGLSDFDRRFSWDH